MRRNVRGSLTVRLVPHVTDDKATQTLIELQQTHAEMDTFLRHAAALPESEGQNLLSLLLTPIQRVPRYRLLLADLRKATPTDHPDAASLDGAYATTDAVAGFINQALRYVTRSLLCRRSLQYSLLVCPESTGNRRTWSAWPSCSGRWRACGSRWCCPGGASWLRACCSSRAAEAGSRAPFSCSLTCSSMPRWTRHPPVRVLRCLAFAGAGS
jgi:hypothetical protein